MHAGSSRSVFNGGECPSAEKLAAHARDELDAQEATRLDTHYGACRDCLDRYLTLTKGTPAGQIPDCQIIKELGRGRFGIVFKAWWLKGAPRLVALKLLSSPGEMASDRFDREIAVLKQIEVPGIVKCLHSGSSEDTRYFVMDYVEGVHLDKYVAKSALTLDEKLHVFQRVCRAVAAAHAKGVVHRDLKPKNILVDAKGNPHILDFGICTIDEEDWSSLARCEITHPGDVIGTLRYMSPEQAWGGVEAAIDSRSDLWALGIILYEIVTDGGYPYSLKATANLPVLDALLDRIRRELPRRPRLDTIPRGRDLETLLSRCLAWEPNRRLQSVARLAEDIERYRRGERIKTRPLSWRHRLQRVAVGAAARSRWPFSLVFVAGVALMLYVVTLWANVGWYASGSSFQDGSDALPAIAGAEQARDQILVVGVYDDTPKAVLDFAADVGIPGVTADIRSWRAVHGYFLKRLAERSPRAVVWDYYFQTPQSGDAHLVGGIQALHEQRVPVILAARTHRADGTPELSAGIVDTLGRRLRQGAIAARDMVRLPGEFVLAVRKSNGHVVPSLSLSTLAAVLHPDARLEIEWPPRSHVLFLRYEVEPGKYLRARDQIAITRRFQARRGDVAFVAGDIVACTAFPMERPEGWYNRTVSYATLLAASDEALAARVDGKVLIVGDLRTPRLGAVRDRHRVRYGRTIVESVPGCFLLADAIAGLFERRYLQRAWLLPLPTYLVMLAFAAVGCLLPIKLALLRALESAGSRRAVLAAIASLSFLCFAGMVLARDYYVVHASMAGLSLAVAMLGSFWVEFARNRHRFLDSRRRAVVGLRFGTGGGTITLVP